MAFDWGNDISQAVEDAIGRLDDYNSGNFNAGSNPLGFGAGGHIVNFPAALTDVSTFAGGLVSFANLMAGYANSASTSASTAAAAATNLSATSTSSVALSTGSKSFSTQAGKTFPIGSMLLASSDANPTTHWMAIQVTSYSGTALGGDVKAFSGSGSRADWTIRPTGFPGKSIGNSYLWSTVATPTPTDPGSGKLRVNAVPASATALYISETDFDGNSLGSLIAAWSASSSSIKGRVFITSIAQPGNFLIIDLTSGLTDNGLYDSFACAVVASGGTLSDGMQVSVNFVPTGNPGDIGPTGPSYVATSTSSIAISVGSKVFTTQAGLAYQVGTRARATDTGTPTNWVEGVVTAYSGTSLTILVDQISGSGTQANWNISVAGERGTTGTTGATGDDGGLKFQFNTATAGDPTSGKFLFNATFLSATQWFVSETDGNGQNIRALLDAIDNGTGPNKILVFALKQGGSAFYSFYVTSVLTDLGNYDTFNISPIATGGTVANNDVFHFITVPLEPGATGATGVPGPTTAPVWTFASGTTAVDPGTNKFALNNAAAAAATALYINETGAASANLASLIQAWDDSTNSTHRGTLFIIQATDSSKYATFTVGTVTDNGTYDTVVLTYVAGPGGFVAGEVCAFSFTRSGNAGAGSGDVVGPAAATNMALALFDGTTGKLLKDSQVDQLTGQLSPVTTDTVSLGNTVKMWSDLFLATGAVINYNNGDAAITHSTGVIGITTGDLRVTTPGTNSTSVVTVGGTQTLTGKTLTSPVINTPSGLTKTDVGLGNVDNTSDANKPISTAGAAINLSKRFASCRAATTGNVTISTALNNADVIDGVTLATGDLVLVKSQSSASENGIYVVAASPARHSEFDTYNEHPGTLVTVQEGTANNDTIWICTSNAGGTLNTTAIAFTQLTVTAYTADGTTLTLTGATFSINLNNANVWTAAQTFINSSGIRMQDTDASNTLGLVVGSNLTANRTLTLTTGDASRVLALGGDLTTGGTFSTTGSFSSGGAFATAGAFTTSGAFGVTLTATGTTTVTLPTTGTLATTDASSLTSGTLADARLSSNATPYGKQGIYIAASAMFPKATGGPSVGNALTVTNAVQLQTLDFDGSTAEIAYFGIRMPNQWNEGTVTFQPVFSQLTTVAGGVVFELAGVAASDGDTFDTAYGTGQTSTKTAGTINVCYIGPESSAITIAGSPAALDFVHFRVQRLPANASDTLAQDARLEGITLFITTDTGHD